MISYLILQKQLAKLVLVQKKQLKRLVQAQKVQHPKEKKRFAFKI